MKFTIVSGSQRANSQTYKVSRFIERILMNQRIDSAHEVYLLDLATSPLSFWDGGESPQTVLRDRRWASVAGELRASDAFVIVSPEWGGMATPALKNFFLLCESGTALSHKPGLIVTLSSSNGGSYPVAELRMSSYKNTRICYIPEHVVIRNVRDMLNDSDTSVSRHDAYIRARLRYSLALLEAYAVALRYVRESVVIDDDSYRYGM